ncbi:hypothetical protein PIIN_02514 [Serendipita indica DSM 11827]|uniref:Uncharacterized protein n=1 Tax=Serendipita indica (strain DSM 11827) TaxID=1109443 RepID=G4TBE5_SERID|nr:hypothetical protein PIIN_02514 [Serendipita indica DSM 11827]
MSGSKQPIEIIELSDDSDDDQETPLVKHLRKELAASRKATKIAQEDKAKLQKELADAKRDLQTVNSTAAQADTSHEEIARILNQELTDVTAALNEAHQVNARLKEVCGAGERNILITNRRLWHFGNLANAPYALSPSGRRWCISVVILYVKTAVVLRPVHIVEHRRGAWPSSSLLSTTLFERLPHWLPPEKRVLNVHAKSSFLALCPIIHSASGLVLHCITNPLARPR